MSDVAMSGRATTGTRGRRRLAMFAACAAVALGGSLGSTPAQAGYYDSYYGGGYRPCSYNGCGYRPCSYRCGYSYGCGSCGCYRRCGYGYSSRRGLVYERRYTERSYVERRYWPRHHHHYSSYGWPYGYRSSGGAFPWGYAGVRDWQAPSSGYGYGGYAPSSYGYGYEPPPRPPAPVWDGDY